MFRISLACYTKLACQASTKPSVYLRIFPFTGVTVNSLEGTNIIDFDNPRSLEKTLSGKELYRKLLQLTEKY